MSHREVHRELVDLRNSFLPHHDVAKAFTILTLLWLFAICLMFLLYMGDCAVLLSIFASNFRILTFAVQRRRSCTIVLIDVLFWCLTLSTCSNNFVFEFNVILMFQMMCLCQIFNRKCLLLTSQGNSTGKRENGTWWRSACEGTFYSRMITQVGSRAIVWNLVHRELLWF